jgi:hypothetical protein
VISTFSNFNLYYNTVYLDGSTTSGTSGIYHAGSTVSTTAKLDLRNNIIYNNSTDQDWQLHFVVVSKFAKLCF